MNKFTSAVKGAVLDIFYHTLYLVVIFPHLDARVSRFMSSDIGSIIDFINSNAGHLYGLGRLDRVSMVRQFRNIQKHMSGGADVPYFLIMAKEVLSIPKNISGDLIECGCYKGKSTSFLSILAEATGRNLWVCDSFAGLPEEGGVVYTDKYLGYKVTYAKGSLTGTLEEVRGNLEKYGRVNACKFVKGYFVDSLPALSQNKYVFAFVDVDLSSSTKDCIRHIWPRMEEKGKIFNDDIGVVEIEKIYFDDVWWREQLHQSAPGLVGSGCGIEGFHSLGYCLKRLDANSFPVINS